MIGDPPLILDLGLLFQLPIGEAMLKTVAWIVIFATIPLVWDGAICADDLAGTPSDSQPPPPNITSESFFRLPELPGLSSLVEFSFDGSQLICAARATGGKGIALFKIELPNGREFLSFATLPDALSIYSLAWSANGRLLAVSAWEHRPSDVKPYQVCCYIYDAQSGEVLNRIMLLEMKTLIHKRGAETRLGWLDDDDLLAKRSDNPQLFRINVKSGNLVPFFDLSQTEVPPESSWSRPCSFRNGVVEITGWRRIAKSQSGKAATSDEISSRETSYEGWNVEIERKGKLREVTRLPELKAQGMMGLAKLLIARDVYFFSYLEPQQSDGQSWVGQFVRRRDARILARLPEPDPSIRYLGAAISPSGTQVALFEAYDLPGTKRDFRLLIVDATKFIAE
jgi:hypothetical protein